MSSAAAAGALWVALVLASAAAATPAVEFRKAYYDGSAGQVHFLIARPAGVVRPDRPPLVMSHPTAQSGDYLRLFIAEMAADRVVLAPDTPGYGGSDGPAVDVSIDDYARMLAPAIRAALAELGYEQADMGGNHTGAFIAAALAIHEPALTRRVLLSAVPYWPPGPERARLLENIGRDRPLTENLDGFAEPWKYHVAQRNPGVSLGRGFSFFVTQLRSEPNHARAFRAVFAWPAETQLQRIEQPVAVLNIAGSLDAQTRAAVALVPNARIADVTGLTTGAWDVGAVLLAKHARALLDEWNGQPD